MTYSLYDFTETVARLGKRKHGFCQNDIASCLAAWGDNGDYAEWDGGFLLQLKDGRRITVEGWCDTTGWGCQDGITISEKDVPPPNADDNPADINRYLRGLIPGVDQPV